MGLIHVFILAPCEGISHVINMYQNARKLEIQYRSNMYKQQLPETLSSRPTLLSQNQTNVAPEWGLQCSMSILINGNVACHCILFSSITRVKFKKRLCPMSLHFYSSCRMSNLKNAHVALLILGVNGHTNGCRLLMYICHHMVISPLGSIKYKARLPANLDGVCCRIIHHSR